MGPSDQRQARGPGHTTPCQKYDCGMWVTLTGPPRSSSRNRRLNRSSCRTWGNTLESSRTCKASRSPILYPDGWTRWMETYLMNSAAGSRSHQSNSPFSAPGPFCHEKMSHFTAFARLGEYLNHGCIGIDSTYRCPPTTVLTANPTLPAPSTPLHHQCSEISFQLNFRNVRPFFPLPVLNGDIANRTMHRAAIFIRSLI